MGLVGLRIAFWITLIALTLGPRLPFASGKAGHGEMKPASFASGETGHGEMGPGTPKP
jgi:hypothetical protein